MRRVLWPRTVGCLLALGVTAGAAAQDELTFNLRDETAPAGSLVQLKLEDTVVTPISGGRPRMMIGSGLTVAGVAMFARDGELAGAALPEDDGLGITCVTTASGLGGEYPILAVSLRLAEDLPAGTEIPVTLAPSIWNIAGVPTPSREAEATVTVGGTLAVTDVVPGQGFFPAGTIVTVLGVGFRPGNTRLRLDGDRIREIEVAPTEIRFELPEAMNLGGAELRIDDEVSGQRVFYYSYLRGTPAATSERPLLSQVQPIFSGAVRSQALFERIPVRNERFRYPALALQNPNLEPVDITLELYAPTGRRVDSAVWPLESGQRLALALSEFFGRARVPCGGSVSITASRPVEAFGLSIDERTRSVTPHLLADGPPGPSRRQPRCPN